MWKFDWEGGWNTNSRSQLSPYSTHNSYPYLETDSCLRGIGMRRPSGDLDVRGCLVCSLFLCLSLAQRGLEYEYRCFDLASGEKEGLEGDNDGWRRCGLRTGKAMVVQEGNDVRRVLEVRDVSI